MPLTAVIVHVTRPGPRADELLAAVGSHLGQPMHAPDERGHVRLLLEERQDAGWQARDDTASGFAATWQWYREAGWL